MDTPVFGIFGYIENNPALHLARKYAKIFVRGNYLFQQANIFSENEAREILYKKTSWKR